MPRLSQDKFFLLTVITIFVIAESWSWLAFNFAPLNIILLWGMAFTAAYLTYVRPEQVFYLVLGELFWGSAGHSFEYGIFNLRLVLFIAIMLTFVFKHLFTLNQLRIFKDKIMALLWSFILLTVVLAIGTAVYQERPLLAIFLDANAYFYLLYLPFFYEVYEHKQLSSIFAILKAATLVVAAKTLLLFNNFAQSYFWVDNTSIYKWVRDSRTGEITIFNSGFWRVFLKSHLYVMLAWLIILAKSIEQKISFKLILILAILNATIVISLSRSLWLGGMLALGIILVYLFLNKKIKLISKFLINLVSSLVLAFIIVLLFLNIPSYNTLNVFSQRGADASEAAASSRLQLLPPLWSAIENNIVWGAGFAKTVTYRSNDPKIKTVDNPQGFYTTDAFEWGWLDIWLKGGLFLVTCFVAWILLIYKRAFIFLADQPSLAIVLLTSLSALVVIHIFTPFINHPLGLGALMLMTVISQINVRKQESIH